MKKLIFLLTIVFSASSSVADVTVAVRKSTGRFIAMQSNPDPGVLTQNAINAGIPASDIEERRATEAEFRILFDNAYAPNLAEARVKRLEEIQSQAMSLYSQYALYSGIQAVIDYGAALRAVPTTAQAEMSALPDVASVKNYQPAWPAKPRLQ